MPSRSGERVHRSPSFRRNHQGKAIFSCSLLRTDRQPPGARPFVAANASAPYRGITPEPLDSFTIRERTYRRQAARKVEIPKGGGKMRQLSIPRGRPISESDLETELYVPLAALRRDESEGACARAIVRIPQQRMIREVEHFQPELAPHPLGDAEVLEQRHIPID